MGNYKFIPLKVRIRLHLTDLLLNERFSDNQEEFWAINSAIASLDLL